MNSAQVPEPIRRRYDVVVVGARCSGAATALSLARTGRSVLLLDKARAGSDTLSTHALTRTGVLLLHRWGLLDAVKTAGTSRVTRVVQQYGDDAVHIPIRPRAAVDGLYAPRRFLLDQLLAQAAAAAGVDVRHRTGVQDVLMGPDGRAQGVQVPGTEGTETVRADLVVGADGAGSLVASRVGAELERVAPPGSATIYTYMDGLPNDAYHNYFRPGSAAGLIPSSGGQANVWVGIPADQFHGGGRRLPSLFDHVLHTVAPELAEQVHARHQPRRFGAFPGRRGFARRPAGPGWALVGDAASFTDPIGAHGMTDAFVAAELLRTAMDEGTGHDDALSHYAERRRDITYPLMPLIEQIASYDWDLRALQSLHLDLNTVMQTEGAAVAALAQPSSFPLRNLLRQPPRSAARPRHP